ncbi:MAG: hypothetical protein IJS60_04835 [Abditibacteriota bacterium]|nr:hypothetical protein [Abditibacteriota bacterium]
MIYLMKGSDDYTKNKELEKLIKENVDEDFDVFDLEECFGDNVTYDRVINGASIVPCGTKKRVFVVRFAHKIPKEDQKIIANNLENVSKDALLIFHTPAPLIKDGKISAGSEVISELEKAIKKHGKILDFAVLTKKTDITNKVIPFVTKLFTDQGKKISPSCVELFVERVGADFVLLNTEAQKVLCYAMDESYITEDMIRNVTSATVEEKIFEFLDLVTDKNVIRAVKGVDNLFVDGNDPRATALKVITLLRSQVTQIWQGLILIKIGHPLVNTFISQKFLKAGTPGIKKEDIASEYHKYFPGASLLSKAPWQQSKVLKIAKKSSFLSMAKWILYLEEADANLKNYDGDSGEPEDIIKMLIYKLVRV